MVRLESGPGPSSRRAARDLRRRRAAQQVASLAFDRSFRAAAERFGMTVPSDVVAALTKAAASAPRSACSPGCPVPPVATSSGELCRQGIADLTLCVDDAPRGFPWPDLVLTAMLRLGTPDVREVAMVSATENGLLSGWRAGRQDRGGSRQRRPRPAGECHACAGQRDCAARPDHQRRLTCVVAPAATYTHKHAGTARGRGAGRVPAPHAVGRVVARVEAASFAGAQDLRPAGHRARPGCTVRGATRHGKFLDLDVDGLHLVFHLARAGWLRWRDAAAAQAAEARARARSRCGCTSTTAPASTSPRPGRKKRLAVYVVRDPRRRPRHRPARPRPAGRGLHPARRSPRCWPAHRSQLKGVLRDQSVIAGIGNAYSDEILHVAKMSPFKLAVEPRRRTRWRLYDGAARRR